MKRIFFFLSVFCALPVMALAASDEKPRVITLAEAVQLACSQSPDALAARHSLRASYWSYRRYRANYLPSLTLTSSPNLNRSINKVTMSDGTVKFVEQNQLNADLALNLTQNIPFTGGYVFVNSSLQRMDMLNNHTFSWQTAPVTFGYGQSLFGYNSLKWDRRIEPLRYRIARQSYVETMELVAVRAVDRFFSLARAQSSYETACVNYANADTLYRYARGRYNIGTITENEMLQLELSKLNEETNLMNARLAVEESMQQLRSYLGIYDDTEIAVRPGYEVPSLEVDISEALRHAESMHPDVTNRAVRQLSARSSVAQAKANAGLKADIYLRFGLTQTADRIDNAYRNPLNQQYVSLSLSLPVLDWGKGKGQVRVARSNKDLVDTQVAQDQVDFEQNVRRIVNQFNLQARRVEVARRADETAQRRNDVARRLYLMGKSTVLDLNASITDKDSARYNYISALYTYWSLFYTLRSLTLYDFVNGRELTADYETLIND